MGGNLEKIVSNVRDSIVPLLIWDPSLIKVFEQPNVEGKLRDIGFMFYQTNLVFDLGLVGGPVTIWLLLRFVLKRGKSLSPESTFWIVMAPFCCLVGILVIGPRVPFGVAHGTLFTVAALGLSFLAGAWSSRKRLAALLLAGCLIDFSWGVLLHAHVQSLENSDGQAVFQNLEFSNQGLHPASPSPMSLSYVAQKNWLAKNQYALADTLLKELPVRHKDDPQFNRFWPNYQQALQGVWDGDQTYWRGWMRRNGGRLTYLGDHIAGRFGGGAVAALLLVLAFGLAAAAIHQIRILPAMVMESCIKNSR